VANPRQFVAPPSFTPLPYGLLSTLGDNIRTPADGHWQAGVSWESLCAEGGTTYDECLVVTGTGAAPAPPPPSKTETTALTRRGAYPFTVYTKMDCSAVGFWDRADELINRGFTQSEQWQVENALWTGTAGGRPVVYPHLAANAQLVDPQAGDIVIQTAATPVSGISTAVDIVEGIGLLESALADCYDGVGVIHVPRVLAAALADSMLLVRDGSRYRTPNGNLVVLGAGYRGTNPAGATISGQVTVYATGAMFIYRARARIMNGSGAFNRAENTLEAIIERNYLIGWDCCHLAINISTGGVDAGTSGTAG
jgi:hypothetical protein